jgi:hypothetical protein
MRTLIVTAVVGLALAAAGTAGAGGIATVGVSPAPPDEAGTPWNARLTVLQHGVTPLDNVQPVLTIRNADTGATQQFRARPTGESGVYETTVKFPEAGTWTYEVWDGFTEYGGARTHTFAPITISGADGTSWGPIWATAGAILLGMALIAGLVLAARRRRPRPDLAPTH